MEGLKTSEDWSFIVRVGDGMIVMDPDGWDRSNLEYSWSIEKISYDEFMLRASASTCANICA